MNSDDLCWIDACDLQRHYRQRELSPIDVVDALIARIELVNPLINAFVTVTADEARADARRAEEDLRRGIECGPLHGIPVAIKDVISTGGIRTTMGSALYRNFVPDDDAFVVQRLKRAGAIIIGKTHTHEFAFAPVMSDNLLSGRCRNPWDLQRIAGASSGGSGAAVASGMVPVAIGTDTSGSVRIPASLCGVVGLKPTYGLIESTGVFPVAASLDTVGPISRSVRDTSLTLQAIAGRPGETLVDNDLRDIRIGVLAEHCEQPIDPEVLALTLAAIDILKEQGAHVEDVSIPTTREAPGIIGVILGREAFAVHERQLSENPSGFGAEVFERLLSNRHLTADDYMDAQRRQLALTTRVDDVMRKYDVLVGPTMPMSAPRFGQEKEVIGANSYPLTQLFALFTRLHSLTGFPAITVPCGFQHDGLPVGLQISGRLQNDATVLRVAQAYQRATGHHRATPSLCGIPLAARSEALC